MATRNLPTEIAEKGPRTALWLPGTSGNYVSAPAAAGTIIGDIDLRWVGSLADWTSSSYRAFISQGNDTQLNYWFGLPDGSTGRPRFIWGPDGSTWNAVSCGTPTGFTDETVGAVRVTANISTNEVKFYTSADEGANWTQLGSTVTPSPVLATRYSSPHNVNVGSSHNGSYYQLNGRTLKAEIRDGIGGAIVSSVDFTAPNGPRYRDAQGNLWTINGSAWAWELA